MKWLKCKKNWTGVTFEVKYQHLKSLDQVKELHDEMILTFNKMAYFLPVLVGFHNENEVSLNESGLHDLIKIKYDGDDHLR